MSKLRVKYISLRTAEIMPASRFASKSKGGNKKIYPQIMVFWPRAAIFVIKVRGGKKNIPQIYSKYIPNIPPKYAQKIPKKVPQQIFEKSGNNYWKKIWKYCLKNYDFLSFLQKN